MNTNKITSIFETEAIMKKLYTEKVQNRQEAMNDIYFDEDINELAESFMDEMDIWIESHDVSRVLQITED